MSTNLKLGADSLALLRACPSNKVHISRKKLFSAAGVPENPGKVDRLVTLGLLRNVPIGYVAITDDGLEALQPKRKEKARSNDSGKTRPTFGSCLWRHGGS